MRSLLLVMLGGAFGAGGRHLVGRALLALAGPGFPWGTLTVNLAGGFAMGLLAGTLARLGPPGEAVRLLLGVGVLGGFTTFSAFGLETATMLLRGDLAVAGAYVAASVAGTVLLLMAGLQLVRAVA